jgi:HSP20 family molecular chaperone IbpA
VDDFGKFLLMLSRHLMSYTEAQLSPGMEPYVELSEDDSGFRIVAELPGVKPKDVRVRVSEGQVILSVMTGGLDVYSESFLTGNTIPQSADIRFRNGVLWVSVKRKKSLF